MVLGVKEAVCQLQQVLETHEVNWQHVLSCVSTLVVCQAEAEQLFKGMWGLPGLQVKVCLLLLGLSEGAMLAEQQQSHAQLLVVIPAWKRRAENLLFHSDIPHQWQQEFQPCA